jgi:hypothetical protein
MTAHRGRKPLAAGHVAHLSGSELAKERLKMILETLEGVRTIGDACAELGVCESRFHALRSSWLQESLELLEPRRTGRPPKGAPAHDAERVAELEAALESLEARARHAELREEIRHILAPPGPGTSIAPGKKTRASARHRRRRLLSRARAHRPR